MATIMASLHMVALLCVYFTVTQAYEEDVLETLLKRIDTLELQGRLQQRRIDEQDSLLERYEVRMNKYEDTLQEYSNRIEQLENQLTTTDKDTDGDIEHVIHHTKEKHEYVSTTTTGSSVSTKKSPEIVNISERESLPRHVLEGPIAFHATDDTSTTPHIGQNQNILFKDVHLNTGNAFHANHGLFIAPKSGLYLFSVSIMTINDGHDIIAAIMKDGTTLAKAYAAGVGLKNDQGSVSIVTQLAIGDEVWVSSVQRGSVSEYGDMFSSFMGCLLSEM